jgi:magnesium chelatase family protein
MDLSIIYSRALAGMEAPLVQVQTHLSNGLPTFHIVGMPETAVRESKERVRSALLNSSFNWPERRITVNLAPADLPKEGGRFDLPIALGILAASGQLQCKYLANYEFLGELALDGQLLSIPGVINAAQASTALKRRLVVPRGCASLAAHVPNSRIIPACDLLTLCAHLNGRAPLTRERAALESPKLEYPDLNEVVGQGAARRALEVAASGGHNLLFFGPPGTGKTLLASRLPGILPAQSIEEALTGLSLRNICGATDSVPYQHRPFRAPHHSASPVALVGGGSRPRPGEISLAHGGVLFLDELPEFSRHALEMLREPMESGKITLSRARHKTTYPARFQLLAAMNPCPCGFAGDADQDCRCTPEQLNRYRRRVSGPLLDRMDLHIAVNRIPPGQLLRPTGRGESSACVRARVQVARERQIARQDCANALIPHRDIVGICLLGRAEKTYIDKAIRHMNLSARAVHRALRVSRTVADLNGEERVSTDHFKEALAYRNPELTL